MTYSLPYKTLVACSLLFLASNNYAMYKPRLQTVKNEEEIRKFAGKFVMYTTTSGYFGRDKGFPSADAEAYKYGYIPHKAENSAAPYTLNQLLKSDELPNTKTILNEMMTQCTLRIRVATRTEEIGIRAAIETAVAKMENMTPQEVMAAILESITQHKNKEQELVKK
jgi:hypothetical protein